MQVFKSDWPVYANTSNSVSSSWMLTPWDNAPWDLLLRLANLSFLLMDAYTLRQCPPSLLLRLANPFPCSAHSKHARVPGCGIVGAFHQSVHITRCFCICILVSVHSFTALVGFWDSGAKPYSPRQLEILTLLVQLDDLAIKPKMYFQFDFNWTLKLWNYSPRRIRPRGDCGPFCDGKRF